MSSMQHQPSAPDLDIMKEEGELEMQSLLTISETLCFSITNGKRIPLGKGDLNICKMDSQTLLLYIPNVFQYAITKQFPSLRASEYSFVFPGHKGSCFGLMFPSSTSSNDSDLFEAILSQYSQYQIDEIVDDNEEQKSKDDKYAENGKKVAKYIEKGTILASKGIKSGTRKLSIGIQKSNEFIKKKIKSRKELQISDQTKKRIQTAKTVSKGVVKVSKAVAVGAKVMCSEIAAAASDAISKSEYGQKFSESENGKIIAVKSVGKATIAGTLVLLEELEIAAIILLSETADATADIAKYKYGKQVGDCSNHVADIVKDSAHIVKNVHDVGLKQMAKNVVGHGAVDVLSTEEEKEQNRKERRMKDLNGVDPNTVNVATAAIKYQM